MPDLLLCADVGGTNTRLRLVDADAPSTPLVEHNYGDGTPVVEAVARFADSHDRTRSLAAAAFGIAGRVVEGDVRMTNRPAEIITDETLSKVLGLAKGKIRVVNDMVAHMSGVDVSEAITLRKGRPEGDVEGIVMPGTGLGVGFAVWHDGRRRAMPGEGGHLDFGPPSGALDVLLACGRAQRRCDPAAANDAVPDRVSWEWFLSGPGLVRIYACFADDLKHDPAGWRQIAPPDITAAASGEKGTKLDIDTAIRAARTFVALTGARAGNLCVELLTSRGVYLGGNILNMLYDDNPADFVATFLANFNAVGPRALRETLENTPIHLIRSPDSGLRGAAVLARERM